MFYLPERRKDHLTRELIDRLIGQVRETQNGLMLSSAVRPEDTRVTALLARCDDEITHYTQTLNTLPIVTEDISDQCVANGFVPESQDDVTFHIEHCAVCMTLDGKV